MTHTESGSRIDHPLRTDDQLVLALDDLLSCAHVRQLWLIFLDGDDRLTGPFMPGSGYPHDPLETAHTDDLGDLSAAQLLSARLEMIAGILQAAAVVLVWEDPGCDGLSSQTRAWVREMATACRDAGVRLRAQLLLDDRGMRVLVPDDFV